MRRNRNKGGRPKGYPKSGGIVYGQTWSKLTVADVIWREIPRRHANRTSCSIRRAKLVAITGAPINTIHDYLTQWRRIGAIEMAHGEYRRCIYRRPVVNI